MTQLANQYSAINLAQGFPNFDIDPLLERITVETLNGNFHQYMPSSGYPPLLENIAALIEGRYGRNADPATEILVTAGATQGIFTAVQAVAAPGDEVVILDPAYDCYDMPVMLRGAVPIHVSMNSEMLPDWQAIGKSINGKTRLLIINNPHNPSGRVWDDADFVELEAIATRFPNLMILSDEVYEFITFEKRHISINGREKLRNRSIVVSSFGKSFHITGWKIGYLIAAEPIMDAIKNIHQFLVFSVNSMAQRSISEYLLQSDVSLLADFYQKKRDHFRNLLSDTKLTLLPCDGTYFQSARYENISDQNDIDFTQRLVKDFGVSAIPFSPFYADHADPKIIRFCFAKDDRTLENAAARLQKL